MKFRTGLEGARTGGNPFAGMTLDERKDLCLEVLNEVGAQNIEERPGHELYHSCCLPFGNHPNGDRNPSASVNYDKMVAGCFVCGNGGWLWWVAAVRGLETSTQARDWIAQRTEGSVESVGDLLAFLDNLYAPKEAFVRPPPPEYDPRVLDQWAYIHPYLTEWRKVPVGNIVDLKVGYGKLRMRNGPDSFVSSERIIIPHFFKGKLLGWQSRRLANDGTPKYSSTPDMPKDSTLFHYSTGLDDAVIVESPMTVLRHTHHAHLMATFGASVNDLQMDLMVRAGKRIVLWFDNDLAGWNATEHVGAYLMERCIPFAVQSPYEGDPGDLSDEQFARVLAEHTVPFVLWDRPDPDGLLALEESDDGVPQVRDRQDP